MKDKLKGKESEIILLGDLGYTHQQIADHFGVDRSSLRRFKIKNNLSLPYDRKMVISDELRQNITDVYLSGKSMREVSEICNVCLSNVRDILKSVKRTTRENFTLRGYPINPECFKDFDNDRLAAYFYGWIITDGCLSKSNTVEIGLKASDDYVLEKLKQYCGSCNKISYKTTITKANNTVVTATFSFSDPTIIERLKHQGLDYRKSMKEKLPEFDCYNGLTAKDFWQGVVEGDGWLLRYDNYCQIGLIGSLELCEGFLKYCKDIIGCKSTPRIATPSGKRSEIKVIHFSNKDAYLISKYLYSDTVFKLERKYQKYLEIEEWYFSHYLPKQNSKYIYKVGNKYRVSVLQNGKNTSLGTYDSFECARSVRDDYLNRTGSIICPY